MSEHTIILERDGIKGFLSSNSIATDGLNAMAEIPGVLRAEVTHEAEEQVELAYSWDTAIAKYQKTDELLLEHGLKRVLI